MSESRKPAQSLAAWGFAAIVLCVIVPAIWLWPQIRYSQERRAAFDLVTGLQYRGPPDVNSDIWELATSWAITAQANVCFSEKCVSFKELKKYRAELEERLAKNVDLATIDWIWKRLGETGPHGRKYQSRFEPQYREQLEAMRASLDSQKIE